MMYAKKAVYHVSNRSLTSNEILNSSSGSIQAPIHETEKAARSKSNLRHFLGFLYVFLHSVFIILSSVIVKKLTYISPGQLSMVRNAGVLAGVLPIAVFSVREVLGPRKYFFMLVLRSFLGATALYLNLMAFRYLPLAEASIILSTLPALVTVTARIYLKEPCGVIQTVALMLTVVGVLLSIRLPELIKNQVQGLERDSMYFVGLASAFGCVFVLSFTIITLRKMTDVHFSVINLYFGALGILENGILTGVFSEFTSPLCGRWDEWKIIMIGVCGFLGHCFFTLAVQEESAGIMTVVKASTDIIVSMVFQVVFFNLVPDVYHFGGGATVLVSVGIIGIRKWLLALPDDSNERKKFKWLLL